jgi:1-acyl-sn-glycerol-3-phosphate acyltransferase
MYYLSYVLLRLLFRLTGGLAPVGGENIPPTGGVILAPNHISYLDPPAVGCGMRRPIRFMAKEELFRSKLLGWWMRKVGAFPVRRGTADRSALKQAIELLGQGEVVCVFPEGTRSPDGNLQEPELGIGLIAMKSRAPVVPVAVLGTDKVLPAGSGRLHRHRVKIVYGPTVELTDLYDARESRRCLEEVGARVMSAIHDLLSSHTC